ncbi:MAG: BolA family transcriptional regulator [Coxiella sp. (in: Bacteria)]|nr:MAG: BolA family transcriptional regulator [Coxiella sp. (in: g-proteobacteria)]
MVAPTDIKTWIEAGLANSHVTADGDGRHFEAVIVCPEFEGKNELQRHRMVFAVLGDKMVETIHALSIKTLTPDEE